MGAFLMEGPFFIPQPIQRLLNPSGSLVNPIDREDQVEMI
jgi:hypothetical protein